MLLPTVWKSVNLRAKIADNDKIMFRSNLFIPRNIHTVCILLCFLSFGNCLCFPYSLCLIYWCCDNVIWANWAILKNMGKNIIYMFPQNHDNHDETMHNKTLYNFHVIYCISFGPMNQSILSQGPFHDDVIKWKHFPRNWPFVREIHRSPVNFPHKGQWRGALMFSLIYAWMNDWVNNREAGDLRRQHGHYDVIVMFANKY